MPTLEYDTCFLHLSIITDVLPPCYLTVIQKDQLVMLNGVHIELVCGSTVPVVELGLPAVLVQPLLSYRMVGPFKRRKATGT